MTIVPGASVVDVSGLDHGDRLHVEVAIPLSLTMDLATLQGPTDLAVDIEATPAGFEVTGLATADLTLVCHRCVAPIEEKLEVEVDDLVTEDPDDGQPTVESDRIDLVPIALDAVGLAVPLRPVCRDDCKGLCPVCGSDLNSDPCGGHDEAPENPFTVLEHLFGSE